MNATAMRQGRAYRDRHEAGEILAAHLIEQLGMPDDAVVLALPRGGVPVGFEVARELGADLDVFVVRKLGVPQQPEFAMGAIAAGGFRLLNDSLVAQLRISEDDVAAVTEREMIELQRREKLYRENRPPINVHGRVAIIVDDGLATGFTMRAAIAAVRERGPLRLVVAVPVGAVETCEELSHEVGTLVCPFQPDPFHAVGLWYQDFTPTSDDEVHRCLAAAATNHGAAHGSSRRRGSSPGPRNYGSEARAPGTS
ncbi:MAG: phosphoribosyltransferase [Opitutaceae bacterium]|nr:phosphoribosyltransferase [Opitutaceae bacterium]